MGGLISSTATGGSSEVQRCEPSADPSTGRPLHFLSLTPGNSGQVRDKPGLDIFTVDSDELGVETGYTQDGSECAPMQEGVKGGSSLSCRMEVCLHIKKFFGVGVGVFL